MGHGVVQAAGKGPFSEAGKRHGRIAVPVGVAPPCRDRAGQGYCRRAARGGDGEKGRCGKGYQDRRGGLADGPGQGHGARRPAMDPARDSPGQAARRQRARAERPPIPDSGDPRQGQGQSAAGRGHAASAAGQGVAAHRDEPCAGKRLPGQGLDGIEIIFKGGHGASR